MLLKTFKYYDHKGRRLSIFANVKEDYLAGPYKLELTVITCSKKDAFCKKTAQQKYDYIVGNIQTTIADPKLESNAQRFIVPIENGKPKNTFIEFCNKTYYKQKVVFLDNLAIPILSLDNNRDIQPVIINKLKFKFNTDDNRDQEVGERVPGYIS
jgi:hypothetical protein